MSKLKIVPVNNGYFNIKSINGEIFEAKAKVALQGHQFGNEMDVLEFEGTEYVVGAGLPSIGFDKTEHDLYLKLFIVNMLSRLTKNHGNYHVFVTAPPIAFANQESAVPEILRGKYNVIHNNKPKTIEIKEVTVVPETFLVILNHNKTDKYKNKTLIIIDIGGYTTNAVRIVNGSFLGDDYATISKGMYHIDHKIAEFFTSMYPSLNMKDESVSSYRRNGEILSDKYKDAGNLWEKHIEDIENIYKEHIMELLIEIQKKDWEYDTCEFLVTGGGGEVLFDIIHDNFFFKAELSDDCLFDNQKGLEALVEMHKQMQEDDEDDDEEEDDEE